jgi:ATP-binding cassette subfamily B multidrug efflux pump
VIAIAHRLSTIARMDRLVVMDAGRIVEQGPHEQLLRAGGHYAQLWKRQSGGFLGLDEAEAPPAADEPVDETEAGTDEAHAGPEAEPVRRV